MKKNIIFAFLLFSAVSTFSQLRTKGTVEIAPFISYQISVLEETFIYTSDRSSASYGAKIDYYFNDRWSLRTGVQYDQLGNDENNGFFQSEQFHVNYISIPLNANWHFGSTRKWNLNFGLTPSFKVSSDVAQNSESINSTILNLSYGIGYKLALTEQLSLLFDIQSLISFGDLYESQTNDSQSLSGSYGLGLVFIL